MKTNLTQTQVQFIMNTLSLLTLLVGRGSRWLLATTLVLWLGSESAWSVPATLSIHFNGTIVFLSWNSTSGDVYQVQTRNQLEAGAWTTVAAVMAVGSQTHWMDSTPLARTQFYQLIQLPPATMPQVVVHVSEYTAAHWTNAYWKAFHPYRFLKEAFVSDGTPFVELTDAQIESGGLFNGVLPKYPILFSLAAECISDAEAGQLEAYVQAGGTVYVGASAWTRYQDGRARTDGSGNSAFALGVALGLEPVGWQAIDRVRVQDGGAMVDHLSAGSPHPWHVAYAYDDLKLFAAHRVFGVWPAAVPPDQSHLIGLGSTGFLPSLPSDEELPGGSWDNAQFGNVGGDVGGPKEDLIYRIDDVIYVRLSNGRSGFGPAEPWTTWSAVYDFRIADVNGDGWADIIGRSGTDVQDGLSTGSAFAPSTTWADVRRLILNEG